MRGIPAFLRDETGSQTIEFLLWLPIIVSLMVIITDASILYLTQTEMWNVARDTARRLSSGQLQTPADAVVYANQQLNLYDPAYVVTATPSASSITVVITVEVVDATIFGYFLTPVLGETMIARVVMRTKPPVVLAAAGSSGGDEGSGENEGGGDDDDHGDDDDDDDDG